MLSLYVIGCGGIGGYLLKLLPETIGSLFLDAFSKTLSEEAFTKHLDNFGYEAVTQLVDRLVLIDGDDFSPRNALRQGFGAGNKLQTRIDDVLADIDKLAIRETFLRLMDVYGFNEYIAPYNMEEMIPMHPDRNTHNQGGCLTGSQKTYGEIFDGTYVGRRDVTVIFLCVDNAKTRYEISKYAEGFRDILVINGGNEKTTGNVTIYERRDGEALDPNLYEVYTEVTDKKDKRPDEVDPCTHIAPKHDQTAMTNCIIASIMCKVFSDWVRHGMNRFGKNKQRRNEILWDGDRYEAMPVYHPPRKK